MPHGTPVLIGGQTFQVSQGFGEVLTAFGPHLAVDIAAPAGTPVEALLGGRVRRVFTEPVGGLQVELEEPGGGRVLFAHLSEARVRAGEPVAPNTLIGLSGRSGEAVTGEHLHVARFSAGGAAIDPLPLLLGGDREPAEPPQEPEPPPFGGFIKPITLPRPPTPVEAGQGARKLVEGAAQGIASGVQGLVANVAVGGAVLAVIVVLGFLGLRRVLEA